MLTRVVDEFTAIDALWFGSFVPACVSSAAVAARSALALVIAIAEVVEDVSAITVVAVDRSRSAREVYVVQFRRPAICPRHRREADVAVNVVEHHDCCVPVACSERPIQCRRFTRMCPGTFQLIERRLDRHLILLAARVPICAVVIRSVYLPLLSERIIDLF